MICLELIDYCLLMVDVVLQKLLYVIANHYGEGHLEGKFDLLREVCWKGLDRCLNGGAYASKRVRKRSIKYETLRTSADFSGEDFQNTGTFIVERSLVFSISSVHSTPLARDAYNALWNGRRPGQVRKYSLSGGAFNHKLSFKQFRIFSIIANCIAVLDHPSDKMNEYATKIKNSF